MCYVVMFYNWLIGVSVCKQSLPWVLKTHLMLQIPKEGKREKEIQLKHVCVSFDNTLFTR